MKRLVPLMLLFVHGFVLSQYEYRLLSPIIDAEKSVYLEHNQVFRSKELPPAEMFSKGPEKILTNSGIPIINIVNSSGGQSETFITYNPLNPNNIIASANDLRYNSMSAGYRMAAYYSTDGGKTWSISLTPPNKDVFIPTPSTGGLTNVDPGLAFDSKGHLYYSYIFTQVSDQGGIKDGGVFVNKSTDGGKTWSDPIPVVISVGGGINQDAHDKPFIACDANANSPFKDRVYVTWYMISPTLGGTIGFAYSSDGEEFSPATRIPGSVSNGGVQSPMPIVASDGTLFVLWENKQGIYTNVMVQKSTNGGASWVWTSPKVAQTVRTIGEVVNRRYALPQKSNMRVSSSPYVTLGSNSNNIYIVQAGRDENGRYRIYFAKSTNGGESWSSKIRVDDNPYGNDMFFPAITYDSKTGILMIVYYSSQLDPQNKVVDLFAAVSFDGGNSWKNIRITPQSWYLDHTNAVIDAGGSELGRYWGDYLSITAVDGKFFPCFWMPNAPRGTFFSNNAYIAILSTAPNPPDSLRYENTYLEPNKVVLKWIDPKTNQIGGELDNFKIWVYRGNDKIAEVDKGVQEYTDYSAIDGELFTYSVKTVDANNLESPLISVSGIAGGSLQPNPPVILSSRPIEGGVIVTWQNPAEHIDGSFLQDLYSIDFFTTNGDSLFSILKEELEIGSIQSKLIPLEQNRFFNIKVRALAKRNDKLTPSKFSDSMLVYSGAPLKSLYENFDEENELIPYFINGTGNWGLTSRISYTPPNCLTDSPKGDYKSKENNYIIFAPVIIKYPNLTLSFEEIAIIDSSGDAGIISISKDFGKTWQDIAWIDQRRFSGFKDSPEASQWFTESRDLSAFENDTILIKFSLVSNPLRNKDGWYIDNLRIDNNPNKVEDMFANSITDVEVYPNPSSTVLNLSFRVNNPDRCRIELLDSFGRIVEVRSVEKFSIGWNSIDFELENFSSGIYQIRIISKGAVKSKMFLIVK
ncbi:MAG: T9SS type A sorting domain-containing protein [Candidatus Kapaibacteriales bacterium]